MPGKKTNFPWFFITAAFLLGGITVWIWNRLTQLAQSPPESSPPTVPTANTADYETWLDWLVNNRRVRTDALPILDVSGYQTWLDPFFNRSRYHWLVTAIGVSLLTFLFGLMLAFLFDFLPLFIRTLAIYLAVFGTAMGLAAFYWVGRAFPPAFAALAPYFGVSTETYAEFIHGWLQQMYNRRAMLILSGIVILTSFIAMVAVFLFPDPTIDTLQRITPSLVMLEREWYFGGANFAKMLIIDLYFLINFALVMSAGWLCIHALIILYHLAKLPILPIPTVITLKLRAIVNIFVVICLVWLVAAAVFTLLFREAFDVLSILWIGSQAVLTLATFLFPQYLSQRIILNLREELITATRLAYDKYFVQFETPQIDPQGRLKLLDQLCEEVNSIKAWPAEPFDWLLILAGQALSPLVVFVRVWIEGKFL